MDMDISALGGLPLAYSMNVTKKAMDTVAQDAANLLNMLPSQQSFRVRGPQPGSVPAVPKGKFFDTYA